MKRNAKLDALRFLYACAVFFAHSYVFKEKGYLFRGGRISVEFFFILSGYLMAVSIQRTMSTVGPAVDLGEETWAFLGKKIRSFMPELLASLVIGFFWMEVTWQDASIRLIGKRLLSAIWEPLLLYMSGLGNTKINGVDWYLSAMILSMLILYPICRKYFSMSTHVIMPAIVILIYGYFCRFDGTTTNVLTEMGFFYKGTVRAFAGLALGVAGYPIITALKEREYTQKQRVLLTIAETVIYIAIFGYMFKYSKKQYNMIFVLFIFVGFCITCMEKGCLDHLFSQKICSFLGKSSLLIYLSHGYTRNALCLFFPNRPYSQMLCLYALSTAINAVLTYFLAGFIRRKFFSGQSKIVGSNERNASKK